MAGTTSGDGANQNEDPRGEGSRDSSADPQGMRDDEVAERWASIVEQLGDLDGDAPADPEPPARPADPGATTAGRVVARTPGPRDWPATPDVEALEEAESHYAPPDPGPVLTNRDPLSTMAWVTAVGVPVLTLVWLVVRSFVTGFHLPGWAGPVGGALFVAAVAVLVWRMPARRDPHDHDDGAVV